jgi:hypothetical protein
MTRRADRAQGAAWGPGAAWTGGGARGSSIAATIRYTASRTTHATGAPSTSAPRTIAWCGVRNARGRIAPTASKSSSAQVVMGKCAPSAGR